MSLPTAQNQYRGNKWNAQIQYAKDQYANAQANYNQQVGTLKFNTWGNAADSGNTRGSYNNYAFDQGKAPLDTSLKGAQQQEQMAISEIQRARAEAAAAEAARKKSEAEAKKEKADADAKAKEMDDLANRVAGPQPNMSDYARDYYGYGKYNSIDDAEKAYFNDYLAWRKRKADAYRDYYLPE